MVSATESKSSFPNKEHMSQRLRNIFGPNIRKSRQMRTVYIRMI